MLIPQVMLVDDEDHIRSYIRTLVCDFLHWEIVAEARNGEEAIELFKKTMPNIVLLDINMPVKTGMDTLAWIKQKHPSTLVIMLTSVVSASQIQEVLSLGVDDYILKETPYSEIQETLLSAWKNHRNP